MTLLADAPVQSRAPVFSAEDRPISPANVGLSTWWLVVARAGFGTETRVKLEADRFPGTRVFLPLHHRWSVRRGVRIPVTEPLFKGYVFLETEGTGDDARGLKSDVLSHDRCRRGDICDIVEINNQRKFVTQLANIAAALDVDPWTRATDKVRMGTLVRILAPHPLMGREGIVEQVVETQSRSEIFLRLEILGQSVSIEVPSECIEVC